MPARRYLVIAIIALVATIAIAADEPVPRFAIVVGDSCLITEHDIASYELASHRFFLTEAAHARRSSYSSSELDRSVPFEVKVDGEVVRSGMVVTPLDSHHYEGPVIMAPLGARGEFTIAGTRGGESELRGDWRILDVMSQVGVLIK